MLKLSWVIKVIVWSVFARAGIARAANRKKVVVIKAEKKFMVFLDEAKIYW